MHCQNCQRGMVMAIQVRVNPETGGVIPDVSTYAGNPQRARDFFDRMGADYPAAVAYYCAWCSHTKLNWPGGAGHEELS